jgi:alkylation response protein AidB-like acyl-CoA dehydrogenase
VAAAVAVEALAYASSSAGVTLGLHLAAVLTLEGTTMGAAFRTGKTVGALALSSADVPNVASGRLTGRAAWVAPVTPHGLAVVGGRRPEGDLAAFAVRIADPGVTVEPLRTAGLRGTACADLTFADVAAVESGPSTTAMRIARVLVSAAGLGMGRRALSEALAAAKRAHSASAGEQTVQGLLADAATELDAAAMLVWSAAAGPASLSAASMAKLAVVSAAQSAVMRATQVIGADSFQHGHIVERLAQDVRALELFAGRTEALREAVAAEVLPRWDRT